MRMTMALTAGVALAALAPAAAFAADPGDRGATFQITPYVWFAGFGGTIRPLPNAPTLAVSKSFADVLEDLEAAAFVTGLARSGRFVAVADLSHSSSSREGLVPTPIPGVPVVPAEGALRQTSATLLGGLRAHDAPGVTIDLLAGVRAWWLRTRIEAPAIGVSRSPTIDFVDPIVATRVNARLGEGWSFLFYGDVGGAGAGSEFTTQVAATINARVAPRVWISGGYRILAVDYRSDTSRADLQISGPLLGATFAF